MKFCLRLGTSLPLLCVISLFTACGFHLRGKINVNSEIGILAISGSDQIFIRQLAKALSDTGIQIAESAPIRIKIIQLQKSAGERIHGSVGYYQKLLKENILYQIETEDNLPIFSPVEVAVERHVSQDQDLTNAAQSEESITYKELRQDLIFRMVNAVTSISVEKFKEEEIRVRALALEKKRQLQTKDNKE
ncbi:MAG: hypothetical protein QS748_05365 [Candidatus Endonucleobacter bathymodioli]|uniref:LPS-assembly lipoprotein LptE n=1 Tax=Candidatus Endonucleibacter bathymodioli TaxID=539814 RepID=A0AA90NL60_9GAMM|nr:hypothetical protein [Candidatus Endonucleobacter bathymodioli]